MYLISAAGPSDSYLVRSENLRRDLCVIRWDEKAGLRRDAIGPQVIDALEVQEINETATKKVNTTAAHEIGKLKGRRLTIGLDLGDRSSYYCVLDEAGRHEVSRLLTQCGQ